MARPDLLEHKVTWFYEAGNLTSLPDELLEEKVLPYFGLEKVNVFCDFNGRLVGWEGVNLRSSLNTNGNHAHTPVIARMDCVNGQRVSALKVDGSFSEFSLEQTIVALTYLARKQNNFDPQKFISEIPVGLTDLQVSWILNLFTPKR